MIIPFIEKYNVEQLRRPTLNLSKWFSPIDGTIRRLSVRSPNQPSIGTHIVNVALDGVYLFLIGSAFNVFGTAAVEKTGLSIAVTKGQSLVWDYVSAGSGFLNVPLFFEVDIEPADLPGRSVTVTYTTASLADAATENGSIALGKIGLIKKVTADRAARIRLYTSSAYRTADAARPIGTDPDGEHGVQMDLYLTPSNLVWDMAQAIPFFDGQSTPTGIVYAAIENKSGSTSTVAVNFDVSQIDD
jgi:hypothetical protein